MKAQVGLTRSHLWEMGQKNVERSIARCVAHGFTDFDPMLNRTPSNGGVWMGDWKGNLLRAAQLADDAGVSLNPTVWTPARGPVQSMKDNISRQFDELAPVLEEIGARSVIHDMEGEVVRMNAGKFAEFETHWMEVWADSPVPVCITGFGYPPGARERDKRNELGTMVEWCVREKNGAVFSQGYVTSTSGLTLNGLASVWDRWKPWAGDHHVMGWAAYRAVGGNRAVQVQGQLDNALAVGAREIACWSEESLFRGGEDNDALRALAEYPIGRGVLSAGLGLSVAYPDGHREARVVGGAVLGTVAAAAAVPPIRKAIAKGVRAALTAARKALGA